MAPVRFGSVTVWVWNGSGGSGFRIGRFLWGRGFSVFQCLKRERYGSSSGPAVPALVPGKTVPAVPVSGSCCWFWAFLKRQSDQE